MEFKINNRVSFKAGHEYEGAVGTVEAIDAEQQAAQVSISGIVNEKPVSVVDWFFFDDLEIAR